MLENNVDFKEYSQLFLVFEVNLTIIAEKSVTEKNLYIVRNYQSRCRIIFIFSNIEKNY